MEGALQAHEKVFIGGTWRSPAGTGVLDVISPHTEAIVGRVPKVTKADLDAAVTSARAAFDTGPWPRMTPAERIQALTPLVDAYAARMPAMASLITDEMGSPTTFSQLAQAAAAWMIIKASLKVAGEHPWEQRREGMMGDFFVRRQPVGVVGAIVPWNVPQMAILTKLIPALLAGCSVVVKPTPETPLDAYFLADMLVELDLPEGVVSLLPAGRDVGELLVRHVGIDKIAFTGSSAAGRDIASMCGAQLKRVSLELGGKSAAIILEDADLTATAKGLRFASFMNSGQACVAQTRILAPRSRYNDVVEAVAEMTSSLNVGDPYESETEIGPLVAQRQQERVRGYIELGEQEGAKLVVGGSAMPRGLDRGWYVQPTVFADVDNSMRIAREEIFGPVLGVIPYVDVEDAIAIANDSQYGLAGSVWTSDPDAGLAVARQIRAGSCAVNTYTSDLVAPFGGFKESGIGREAGPEGLDAYVELQSIAAPS